MFASRAISNEEGASWQAQAAFLILPARIQAVHARICFELFPLAARTRFKFGFQRRRRVLFAWLTTFPYCGPLPQISHFIAISYSCFVK